MLTYGKKLAGHVASRLPSSTTKWEEYKLKMQKEKEKALEATEMKDDAMAKDGYEQDEEEEEEGRGSARSGSGREKVVKAKAKAKGNAKGKKVASREQKPPLAPPAASASLAMEGVILPKGSKRAAAILANSAVIREAKGKGSLLDLGLDLKEEEVMEEEPIEERGRGRGRGGKRNSHATTTAPAKIKASTAALSLDISAATMEVDQPSLGGERDFNSPELFSPSPTEELGQSLVSPISATYSSEGGNGGGEPSSQGSSVFDMCFESPPKTKAAAPKRAKRMGVLSPVMKDPQSPSGVKRKLPPQYEFRGEGGSEDNGGSPQRPKTLASDHYDSPSRKEILMPVRNPSTITYGKASANLMTAVSGGAHSQREDGSLDLSDDSKEVGKPGLEQLMEGLEADTTIVKFDEGLESDDEDKPKALGFHELIAAGNSKRIADELRYLMEGICSDQLNIKRASCLDFFKKISKEGFVNYIRTHGDLRKVFDQLKECEDPLVQVMLTFIIAGLCYKDFKNIEALVNQEFVEWLWTKSELFVKNDILINPPKKKYDKALVIHFETLVKKEGTPEVYEPFQLNSVTPVIYLISQTLQNSENDILDEFIPSTDWIERLKFDYRQLQSFEDTTPGKPQRLNEIVCILESLTNPRRKKTEVFYEAQLNENLWIDLHAALDIILGGITDVEDVPVHLSVAQSILRILVNIYGPNGKPVSTLAMEETRLLFFYYLYIRRRTIIDAALQKDWCDLQMLILGLMINIAQDAGHAQVIPAYAGGNACSLSCLKGCSCKISFEGLELLAKLFEETSEKAKLTHDSSTNLQCAYLALFIGHVVKHEKTVKARLQNFLPSESMDDIVSFLKEYLDFMDALPSEFSNEEHIRPAIEELLVALQ